MFRKLIEQQIEIENIPFFKQMFQTDIIVFLQQVNIMIHKIIKHAASKYSAHSPALQHQPCRFINFQVLHLNLPNFIFITLFTYPVLLLFVAYIL